MPGKIFIVSAPSGAGKTTLVTKAIEELGSHYSLERVVTYTSRPPRATEKQGIDYHFISEHEFAQKIHEGFFLEYSTAYGTYYGSPRHVINKVEAGTSYIMIVDRLGAQRVVEQLPETITIWLQVELPLLKERLEKRGSESDAQITRRLALAAEEFEQEWQSPFYNYYVYNDNFDDAFDHFTNILTFFLNQNGEDCPCPKLALEADKNKKELTSHYIAD